MIKYTLLVSIIAISSINAHFDSSDSRLLKAGKVGLSAVAFRYSISPNTVRLAHAYNISLKKFGSFLKEAEKILKISRNTRSLIEQKMAANQPLTKTEQNLKNIVDRFDAKIKEFRQTLSRDEFEKLFSLTDHLHAIHENPKIIDRVIKQIQEAESFYNS